MSTINSLFRYVLAGDRSICIISNQNPTVQRRGFNRHQFRSHHIVSISVVLQLSQRCSKFYVTQEFSANMSPTYISLHTTAELHAAAPFTATLCTQHACSAVRTPGPQALFTRELSIPKGDQNPSRLRAVCTPNNPANLVCPHYPQIMVCSLLVINY